MYLCLYVCENIVFWSASWWLLSSFVSGLGRCLGRLLRGVLQGLGMVLWQILGVSCGVLGWFRGVFARSWGGPGCQGLPDHPRTHPDSPGLTPPRQAKATQVDPSWAQVAVMLGPSWPKLGSRCLRNAHQHAYQNEDDVDVDFSSIFGRFLVDFGRILEVMLAAKMHHEMMSNLDEFLIIF